MNSNKGLRALAEQLTLFDYSLLDSQTASFVRERVDSIRALGKRVVGDVIAIGRNLAEVKDRLPHGAWLPWLQAEFGWSDRTARRFTNALETFGKLDTVSDLEPIDLGALYLLAAPGTPEPVRDAVIERAREGERITHADAKSVVQIARKVTASAQAEGRLPTVPEIRDAVREATERATSRRPPRPGSRPPRPA